VLHAPAASDIATPPSLVAERLEPARTNTVFTTFESESNAIK